MRTKYLLRVQGSLGPLVAMLLLATCATNSGPAPGDRFSAEPIRPVLYMPFDGDTRAFSVRHLSVTRMWGRSCRASFGPGILSQAIRFDGSIAGVDVNGVYALGIYDALTLEVWVNVDDSNRNGQDSAHIETLIALGLYGGERDRTIFKLAVDFDSWLPIGTVSTNMAGVHLRGDKVAPGSWHHVALGYADSEGKVSLYVDGKLIAEQHLRGVLWQGGMLYIGHGPDRPYFGMMDELRIYRVLLNAEQIRAHAAAP